MSDEIDDSVWFDEFWEAIPDDLVDLSDDSDNGEQMQRLVRLWGEAFRAGLIWRDGDELRGRLDADGRAARLDLQASDQYLLRQIEEAADRATVRAGASDEQ